MILPAFFIKVDRDIDMIEKKLDKKINWIYYRGTRPKTKCYSMMVYLNRFDSKNRLTKDRLNMLDGSEFLASVRKQTNKVLWQSYIKLKVETVVFGDLMSARTIPARDDRGEYDTSRKFLQWFLSTHSLGRIKGSSKSDRFEKIMRMYDENIRLMLPMEAED